jgi:hypothetical protein
VIVGACAVLALSATPSSAQGRDVGVRSPELGGVRSDYYQPRFSRPVPRPPRIYRNQWYRYRAQDRARWAREYRNEMRRAMREYQREVREARREYQNEIRKAWRGRWR